MSLFWLLKENEGTSVCLFALKRKHWGSPAVNVSAAWHKSLNSVIFSQVLAFSALDKGKESRKIFFFSRRQAFNGKVIKIGFKFYCTFPFGLAAKEKHRIMGRRMWTKRNYPLTRTVCSLHFHLHSARKHPWWIYWYNEHICKIEVNIFTCNLFRSKHFLKYTKNAMGKTARSLLIREMWGARSGK